MEKLLIPAPSEIITVNVFPSSTYSNFMIHFEGVCAECFLSQQDRFVELLKEELHWSIDKVSEFLSFDNPSVLLINREEFDILKPILQEDRIKELEAEEKARTATPCGIKLMVGIKKNALEEKNPNEVIWEILKESPLIEKIRFENYFS
tara:strand:+ start:74 stop:520 length:447 start_codon:yes stop_codon:yes gene_type:complete